MIDRVTGVLVAGGLFVVFATVAAPSLLTSGAWRWGYRDEASPRPSATVQQARPSDRHHERATFPTEHLRAVDAALAEHDVSGAVRRWHDLWGAALASRRWDAMIAAGDAFVRIGDAAHSPGGAKANARQAYLSALVRARSEKSVDGVLRASHAFAALRDYEVAQMCVAVAEELVSSDPDPRVRERVKMAAIALGRERAAQRHRDG